MYVSRVPNCVHCVYFLCFQWTGIDNLNRLKRLKHLKFNGSPLHESKREMKALACLYLLFFVGEHPFFSRQLTIARLPSIKLLNSSQVSTLINVGGAYCTDQLSVGVADN